MIKGLTARRKLFAERCINWIKYGSHTDAYLSVYKSKGTRKTATSNASRIYNSKPVQEYLQLIHEADALRANKEAEAAFKEHLASMGIYR